MEIVWKSLQNRATVQGWAAGLHNTGVNNEAGGLLLGMDFLRGTPTLAHCGLTWPLLPLPWLIPLPATE